MLQLDTPLSVAISSKYGIEKGLARCGARWLFLPVSIILSFLSVRSPAHPAPPAAEQPPTITQTPLLHSPGCLVSPSHVAGLDEGKGIIANLLGIIAHQSTMA